MSTRPRALTEIAYYHYAQEYLRSLPLEHFMEATPQATQHKITLESFDLVHTRRPDIQVFNELLVQHPRKGHRKPVQVVPDNMVVLHPEPIKAEGSFDVPLQPVGPFLVLEYVSKSSKRKDYDDNMKKYEQQVKVPYYLLFYPETQDLSLSRHSGKKYVSVTENEHGRFAIPELELEVAILDGWVRFWFREKLVPLPGELQREFDSVQQQVQRQEDRLRELEKELARLRSERPSPRPD